MFLSGKKLVALALTATLTLASAAQAEPQAIYGGNKVKPCAWPTTVSLGGCTGTLVHPELVVFAAHCMSGSYGPSVVTFGDNENQPAFKVATSSCKADPKYYSSSGRDVAYCKLAQPVTSVPIVPILMGCETQSLAPGASVVAVGFGQANDGLGWGPKREVTMSVNSIANGEAFIGGAGKDTCYGDSGGPVYIRLSDGAWRVFGITSYGEYCGGGGYYSMMHTAIDWLEQSSGVDLTPCFDGGQWAPGPDCGHFPVDAELGGGSWSSGCATGNVSPMSATCGAAFGGGSGGGSGVGGSSGFGGTGTGGGGSGFGGSGGGDGFGGSAGVGGGGGAGGGAPPSGPTGPSGCSAAPDCAACGSCFDKCVCLTADANGCADACTPYASEPPAGAGGGTATPSAGDRGSDGDTSGGCTCRAASPPARAWSLAPLFALALGWMRRRRA